jgi:dephospho-CoA kinase
MIVVGLTGRIGAGKSTVAGLFADRGAIVVDADQLAHEVLGEPEVAAIVAERFGPGVVAADGSIERRSLAKRVFGPTAEHAAALECLEAIIHPRVAARIDAILDARSSGDPSRPVVLDVPLLLKSGIFRRCTHLVEVVCDDPVRRARLAARGWDSSEIEARDAAWDRSQPRTGDAGTGESPPAAEFLDTSGDVRYTSQQVDQLLRTLTGDGPGQSG